MRPVAACTPATCATSSSTWASLKEAQGHYGYALDGGDQVSRDGFPSPEDALADIAGTVTFLYLDGQFTALEDLSEGRSPDLSDMPQIQVSLTRWATASRPFPRTFSRSPSTAQRPRRTHDRHAPHR